MYDITVSKKYLEEFDCLEGLDNVVVLLLDEKYDAVDDATMKR